MVTNRMEMINSYLREVISTTLHKVKDPRLSPLISVVDVVTSKDLRTAKVFVSLMGNAKEKERNLTALRSAAGFIRKEIGPHVSFKTLPELIFLWDESIERGMKIVNLINNLNESDDQSAPIESREDFPEEA